MTIDRESLRPAFERICPVPDGLGWDADQQAYVGNGNGAITWTPQAHAAYQGSWEGFCAAFESLGEPVAYERHAYDGTDTLARKPSMPRSNLFLSSTPLYRLPEVKA